MKPAYLRLELIKSNQEANQRFRNIGIFILSHLGRVYPPAAPNPAMTARGKASVLLDPAPDANMRQLAVLRAFRTRDATHDVHVHSKQIRKNLQPA